MTGADREALRPLEDRIGHRFAEPKLLAQALTHRSWAFEQGTKTTYERLEFLGDAVLGLVTARFLFQRIAAREGELSKLKAHLVSAPRLAAWARALDLGSFLRLGVGEERSGGRAKESLLADVFEAVLAAVYLDGGPDAAARFVTPFLEEVMEGSEPPDRVRDPKTALQELLQARGLELPEYRLAEEVGPDHAKTFHLEVWLGARRVSTGQGSSKKRAEQAAAAAALEELGGVEG